MYISLLNEALKIKIMLLFSEKIHRFSCTYIYRLYTYIYTLNCSKYIIMII